jgi:Protein of unknown function (DUF3617)
VNATNMLVGFMLLGSMLASASEIKMPMKAGLWEITSKTESTDPAVAAQMKAAQEAMAQMPPEQRKIMEDAMKKSGVSMNYGGDGSMTMKMCVSQAMVDQGALGQQNMVGDCKTSFNSAGANTYKMSYRCNNPKSNGEGTYVFAADGSYEMSMKTNTVVDGKDNGMTIKGNGKYLGDNCGDIKPMVMPKSG